MRKEYALVVVDIEAEKLDRPFTYRIPEELSKECIPGAAVKIPFGRGNREISGYVVGLTGSPDLPEEKIKPVLEVTAGNETAEGRLVKLAAWMSRRYGSTMIRALKTVLPVRRKVGAVTERVVTLGEPEKARELLDTYERKHYAAKARVLRVLLSSHDPDGGNEAELPSQAMDLRELEERAGVPLAVVKKMAEEGVLRIAVSEIYRRVTEGAGTAPPDVLSGPQREVTSQILAEWSEGGSGRPVLLTGVTGSGKTMVYIELVAETLRRGEQAIVLIPEIALTWQTVMRFVRRFGDRVSFLHSRLSKGERYDQMKAAKAGDVSVMVGPRSALFTPFQKLGLIVIDEEHEESYHSEIMPRYRAGEVAIRRGEIEGAKVIFGSATPSVESAYRAAKGEYLGTTLTSRFGGSILPDTAVVDMREELKKGNRSILSDTLRKKVEERLKRGEQTMLFLNRRGYAGAVTCRSCGHVMKCPHCDVSLTRHRNGKLICHYCGYEREDIRTCPECASPNIGALSIGTEQVEELVMRTFPAARVLRMDLDTTRGKEGHTKILKSFSDREADILIGTQMIVKGHDFPGVTLVGVLLADLSLNDSDYRSSERTYQLIAQAVGRAGRGEKAGEAVIQTYSPDHFAILAAAKQDYDAFFKAEIAYRKVLAYPPAGGLLAVLGSAADEELLSTGMKYLRMFLGRIDPAGKLMPIGPAPQSVGKIKDQYRQVIYLRSERNEDLIKAKDLLEEYIDMNRGFDAIHIMFDFE